MDSIIIGVGNPLLGDDAIGLEIASKMEKMGYNAKKAIAGGLELAEMITGYDFAVIVDAFQGEGIKDIDIEKYEESVANHDINFPSAYKILSRYVKMPEIRVIGVGIGEIRISEKISSKVKEMIPNAVKKIKKILEEENELVIR